MSKHPKTIANAEEPNLRGSLVWFVIGRQMHYGRVITYLRDDLWSVGCEDGRRFTLHREAFALLTETERLTKRLDEDGRRLP